MARTSLLNDIKIELSADNDIEAFGAYINYEGGFDKNESPKILVNFRSMALAAADMNMTAEGYKYFFAETVLHEMLHMIQAIFQQAFDEDEVEQALLSARRFLVEEKINEFYNEGEGNDGTMQPEGVLS